MIRYSTDSEEHRKNIGKTKYEPDWENWFETPVSVILSEAEKDYLNQQYLDDGRQE